MKGVAGGVPADRGEREGRWGGRVPRCRWFPWLVLFSLAPGLVASAGKTVKLPRNGKLEVGAKAPSLASWDLQERVVTLSKVLSRPRTRAVLVSFFASWCKECPTGLRRLQAGRARLAEAGVSVLLVDCGEETETILRFLKAEKISLPVVTDEFDEIRNAYGVRTLPQAFLIGRDQKIRAIYIYEGEDLVDRVLEDVSK